MPVWQTSHVPAVRLHLMIPLPTRGNHRLFPDGDRAISGIQQQLFGSVALCGNNRGSRKRPISSIFRGAGGGSEAGRGGGEGVWGRGRTSSLVHAPNEVHADVFAVLEHLDTTPADAAAPGD